MTLPKTSRSAFLFVVALVSVVSLSAGCRTGHLFPWHFRQPVVVPTAYCVPQAETMTFQRTQSVPSPPPDPVELLIGGEGLSREVAESIPQPSSDSELALPEEESMWPGQPEVEIAPIPKASGATPPPPTPIEL